MDNTWKKNSGTKEKHLGLNYASCVSWPSKLLVPHYPAAVTQIRQSGTQHLIQISTHPFNPITATGASFTFCAFWCLHEDFSKHTSQYLGGACE